MRMFFTARHKEAIDKKKLKLNLPTPLRVGIERILSKSSWIDDYSGENCSYRNAEETLKTFYGWPSLRAYKNSQRIDADFRTVLVDGWPGHVFDCIEAWFEQASPNSGRVAESEINELLAIRRSEWRLVNGCIIRIDSEYLHDELVAGSLRLMAEIQAAGAQEELQSAVNAFTSGDCKKAVTEAHKSVESTMKCVLEARTGTFGHLLHGVLKKGIVPEYYREFFTHFEKLALGAVKERNLPGRGHGQGIEPQEVSPGLARFALHLAGAINFFLIERWLEARNEAGLTRSSTSDDNIPF